MTPAKAAQVLIVYPAPAFRATGGVNQGDRLGPVEQLCAGDTYALTRAARPEQMRLEAGPQGYFTTCHSGARLAAKLTAHLTLMTAIGHTVEALLVSCAPDPERPFLHPLGPIEPETDYALLAIGPPPKTIPLADLTGLSFGRGTHITLAGGRKTRAERLRAGVQIQTRDHGAQPLRWIGHHVVQSVGDFAPVIIAQGSYGNTEDLVLGQRHRVLISDWRAEVMFGTSDVLIAAADLVNDDTVYLRQGGFVDYVQLVFDRHQIIEAEGVPVESLYLSPRILAGLPVDHAAELERFLQDAPTKTRHPLLGRAQARRLLREAGRL